MLAALLTFSAPLAADICTILPYPYPISSVQEFPGYERIADVAQYGGADWGGCIGVVSNISIEKAIEIADSNPEITYFFYMKGCQMVLDTGAGSYYVFCEGDAVFFSGSPAWGSAVDFADGYVKQ